MRFVPLVASLVVTAVVSSPGLAASDGLPTEHFVQTWTATPSGRFTADRRPVKVTTVSVRLEQIPEAVLPDAFASASDTAFRRDLAIDEMASVLEPARRTALEDLRDAQRRYAASAGGDTDSRGAHFATLLRQVIDGSGRSVARDGENEDKTLDKTYERVIRDAPDSALPTIEASETTWIAYRDAFDRFARAVDHPDAVAAVNGELGRYRANELKAEAAQ